MTALKVLVAWVVNESRGCASPALFGHSTRTLFTIPDTKWYCESVADNKNQRTKLSVCDCFVISVFGRELSQGSTTCIVASRGRRQCRNEFFPTYSLQNCGANGINISKVPLSIPSARHRSHSPAPCIILAPLQASWWRASRSCPTT